MIVVLGAGLIGLAIANEVARRGAEVRIIEMRDVGRGASWAGAGMLAPYTETIASPAFEAFCADSLARYPAFVAGLRATGGVDARLRLDGILEAAFDEATARRLRAHAAVLTSRGIAARYLDRAAASREEPSLAENALGAIVCDAEGSVDNRRLGRALHAACLARGVRIDVETRGVALEADTRRVLGVRGATGFVPAEIVVNALGAWAGSLEGVPERFAIPVTPVKGQMLALAMPPGFVRRTTWVPGAYLVPRDDGRLLVGATVEPTAGYDVRVTASGVRALLDAAIAALPALGDFALSETWAGLRPGTPDELPYLGATELGGYVLAAGHYRNGILLTPATATAIANVLEGRAAPEIAAFSVDRLRASQGSVDSPGRRRGRPTQASAVPGQEARASSAKGSA